MAPPADEPVSLTREGKRRLRERYEELKGLGVLSLEKIGKKLGVTHGAIRTLIYDETNIGRAIAPVWSSPLVPGLCRILGVPLWEVVAGIDEDQARLLAILERVREAAPDAVDGFIRTVETLAAGTVDQHASKGGEDEVTPRLPNPPLRPVR